MLRQADKTPFAADAVSLSLRGEAYSDFLGRGKRTFMNPFFGYSLGWSRITDVDFLSFGLTAGVELVKTDYVLVDLAVNGAALTNHHDLRMAVEPHLGVNVAF